MNMQSIEIVKKVKQKLNAHFADRICNDKKFENVICAGYDIDCELSTDEQIEQLLEQFIKQIEAKIEYSSIQNKKFNNFEVFYEDQITKIQNGKILYYTFAHYEN